MRCMIRLWSTSRNMAVIILIRYDEYVETYCIDRRMVVGEH
jgi:hypothetical protein